MASLVNACAKLKITVLPIFVSLKNTTIKNCYIDGFSTAIDLKNSTNASISNNTMDAYEYGVSLEFGETGSDYAVLRGNTIYAHNVNLSGAIDIFHCGHAAVEGNLIYSNGSAIGAAIFLHESGGSNFFFNNTIISNQTAVFSDNPDAGNNTYLLNNITALVWVNDNQVSSEKSHYNNATAGSIYYFVNGTPVWEVFDVIDTNSDNWADAGSAWPFNATTTGGRFIGVGLPQDRHPWTGKTKAK